MFGFNHMTQPNKPTYAVNDDVQQLKERLQKSDEMIADIKKYYADHPISR